MSRVLVVFASLSTVLALLVFIGAAVSWSSGKHDAGNGDLYVSANAKSSGNHDTGNTGLSISADAKSGQVYVMAVTGRKRPFSYINAAGQPQGFDVDITNAVCEEAGQACRVEQWGSEACGTTGEDGGFKPGQDLSDGNIDMCASRGITDERLQYFDFTLPYYTAGSYFHVKKGNPRGFDESNVKGRIIAHLDGTYADADCLRKYGFTGADIVPIHGIDAALEAVEAETVDALFAPRRSIPQLERVSSNQYECSPGGGAMVRRGSPITAWWNAAFMKLVQDGRFKSLCDTVYQRHAGNLTCYPY